MSTGNEQAGRGSARLAERIAIGGLVRGARAVARVAPVRRAIVSSMERRLRDGASRTGIARRYPAAVEADRLAMKLAILRVAERALAENLLGDAALRGFIQRLVYGVWVKGGDTAAKDRFRAAHGMGPPDFLVLSPGKTCNLQCIGCYASSGPTREKLPWATLERIVREAHDLWGSRFFVLSGGETMAYRDDGKGLLDLAERFPDCYFLMYTNGTLITDAVARRMGELGNVMPGLSVEGMEARTDARRGAGVFRKVLAAMERLRRERVLFGLSLTATRENAEEILSEELVDLFFGKMGALFAFVFHYMPIGRAFTLDLMMTPEQRVRLWEREWKLVRDERIFIADFWNSGTASNGCVAAGRPGGYFYINWDGWMSPCVFMPYAPLNIKDLYARGGTLDDAWGDPFFAGLRAWQRDYGYREDGETPAERCGNWLNPCPIRDHHDVFHRLVRAHHPTPTDPEAAAALADPSYHEGIQRFDRELAALNDPIWESRYRGIANASSLGDGAAREAAEPIAAD
ncbi:MAG TPA: radical SAM protein [Gemmatimonadaceae bacterium]|nr:radical SAM protein [Gemmatimonadaceae bacterium]